MNNRLRYLIVASNVSIILFFWTFLVNDSIFRGAYEIVFQPSQPSQPSQSLDSKIGDEIKGEIESEIEGEIESFTMDSMDSMDSMNSMEKQKDNENSELWDGYQVGPIHILILLSTIILVIIVTFSLDFIKFKDSDCSIVFSDLLLTNVVMHPTILSFANLQDNMRILIVSAAIIAWSYLILCGVIIEIKKVLK